MDRSAFGRAWVVPALAIAVLIAFGVGPAQAAPGHLDPTFGTGGKVITPIGREAWANAVAIQPDKKIVAAGGSWNPGYRLALARYEPDGSLDTGFGSDGTVTAAFEACSSGNNTCDAVLQPDGKIVVAGGVGSFGGFVLARFTPSGSLDPTFGTAGKVMTTRLGRANAVVLQSDGKIVAAGAALEEDGSSNFGLARYKADGSLDQSFGTGGIVTTQFGGTDYAEAVTVQSDGKIVAAGTRCDDCGLFYGVSFAVARYNADGSLDSSFGSGGKAALLPGFGFDLALQQDGKIMVSGGEAANAGGGFVLRRYNPDGSVDISFGRAGTVVTRDPCCAFARAVAVQPDGEIVAAGIASGGHGFGLARYQSSGRLDRGFGSSGKVLTGNYGRAFAVALQPDGKIVAAGEGVEPGNEGFALARYLGGKGHCDVPSVKGRRLANAKRAIRRAYCSVGRVRRVFSSWHWKRRVISQKPKPGAQRRVGAKVRLVVGKGPRRH